LALHIRKSLGGGAIRFKISPRQFAPGESDNRLFSTGPAGEFLGTSAGGFFFSEPEKMGETAYTLPGGGTDGFRFPSTPADFARWGLMAFGALLILWGLLLFRKNAGGAVVMILIGLALIVTPIAIAMKKQRDIRMERERLQAQRDAADARDRELISTFLESLERLKEKHDPEALRRIGVERDELDVPYVIISPYARATVLRLGFDAVSRHGEIGSEGVAREVDAAADAVRLSDDDRKAAKAQLYATLVWHLLAEDRLGEFQKAELDKLRGLLRIEPELVVKEDAAMAQFAALRGLTRSTLPQHEVDFKLKYQEVVHHRTSGKQMKLKGEREVVEDGVRRKEPIWAEIRNESLFVTSKRFILGERKGLEIPLSKIYGIEVDADRNILSVREADKKTPYYIHLEDPIYTAAVLNLAAP
jgi:hypothetical protein